MLCCREQPDAIQNRNCLIADDYRDIGPVMTCRKWRISSRDLYKIPEVQQERARRLLDSLPRPVLEDVLEDYR